MRTILSGKVTDMVRLRNTRNGGPRFQVSLVDEDGQSWTVRTAGDTSESYRWDPAVIVDEPVLMVLNGRGTVEIINVIVPAT